MSNEHEFDRVHIFRDRDDVIPDDVDAADDARVFNAPRPLYGTTTWKSAFLRGIFYAAVDPDDDRADDWLTHNERQRAVELVFTDRDEAIQWALGWYEDNLPDVLDRIDVDNPEHRNLLLQRYKEERDG